jgi:hypothetical protein
MNKLIHCGNRSYEIKSAHWDADKHVGLIQVRDDGGNSFIVESDGLAPNEQRQAVASFAMHRASSLAGIMHGPTCPCVNCT